MRLSVDFACNRAGTAELAWGQRDIWRAIDEVGPDSAHYFNVPRLLAVPRAGGPRDPQVVAAALTEVMGRHDALRSLVRLGAAGPYQEVAAAGTVSIELVEAARGDADDAAADLVDRLAGRSFGDGEQPLRAGLVVCDGAATHVALVLNHVVATGTRPTSWCATCGCCCSAGRSHGRRRRSCSTWCGMRRRRRPVPSG